MDEDAGHDGWYNGTRIETDGRGRRFEVMADGHRRALDPPPRADTVRNCGCLVGALVLLVLAIVEVIRALS